MWIGIPLWPMRFIHRRKALILEIHQTVCVAKAISGSRNVMHAAFTLKLAGGSVQGYKGTLFGTPYKGGSWQDKLIESFAVTRDMIGGKLSGLYDDQGKIKRGMSETEQTVYNKAVTTTAILPSVPFAAAQGLPPQVWNAIGILLGAAK